MISAIVPCYNAGQTIGLTLSALDRSSIKLLEVICVDDGSQDDTQDQIAELARTARVTIRCIGLHSRRGAAAARNAGARLARGTDLLFIDADTVPAPDALEHLARALHLGKATAVVGLYNPFSIQPGPLAHFQAHTVSDAFSRLDPGDSPYFGTQCVLITADVFRSVGGFDERYRAATVEDFAFGCRLRARGGLIRLEQAARITHNHRYTAFTFARNYYAKARDLGVLIVARETRTIARGSYSSLKNLLAFALVLGSVWLVVLAAAGLTPPSLVLFDGVALVALFAPYFTSVRRDHGLLVAAVFLALRVWVTALGGLGATVGIWRGFRRKCVL